MPKRTPKTTAPAAPKGKGKAKAKAGAATGAAAGAATFKSLFGPLNAGRPAFLSEPKYPLGTVLSAGVVKKCPRDKAKTQWIRFAPLTKIAICARLLDITTSGLSESEVLELIEKNPERNTLDKKTVNHLAEVLEGRSKRDWSEEAYMAKFDPRSIKISIKEMEELKRKDEESDEESDEDE